MILTPFLAIFLGGGGLLAALGGRQAGISAPGLDLGGLGAVIGGPAPAFGGRQAIGAAAFDGGVATVLALSGGL